MFCLENATRAVFKNAPGRRPSQPGASHRETKPHDPTTSAVYLITLRTINIPQLNYGRFFEFLTIQSL